ncbi:hypothetical protein HI914_07061 [Erysiphe necator]|nr:hypothetical protein HI914_07061 [Erysiphe necator]
MCQNQHTAHLRSSDSSQRENEWLSNTAISHNEFQGILLLFAAESSQNPMRKEFPPGTHLRPSDDFNGRLG